MDVTSLSLLIGTATDIRQVRVDPTSGSCVNVGTAVPCATSLSLTPDPLRSVVWSASLDDDGRVSTVHTGPEGPRAGTSSPTGGAVPCHVGLVAAQGSARTVAVANYSGHNVGIVSSIDVTDPRGGATLEATVDFGEGSHPHQVLPLGNRLVVSDLGLDSLHLLDRDDPTNITGRIQLDQGAGPRDAVLIGEHLVVALEVGNAVGLVQLDRDDDATITGGRQVARHDFTGAPEQTHPSQIIADSRGRALVLNRGSDTLCVVEVADGRITSVTEHDLPAWPMDLVEVDGTVLVACRDADVVVGLDLDDPDTELFRFAVPSPNALVIL